ncbi:MAG: flagellar basal body-associated FliL family protein [Pseudomonadota bacterium]
MKKLILPVVLAVIGGGGGGAAGKFLKPAEPPDAKMEMAMKETNTSEAEMEKEMPSTDSDFVKLNNQFVVPLINGSNVQSLIVISLSLEIASGNIETVYANEPRLRDVFLQVLFDHANAGGFSDNFTQSTNMLVLRDSLVEIARRTLGDIVKDVLIVDLIRQDN